MCVPVTLSHRQTKIVMCRQFPFGWASHPHTHTHTQAELWKSSAKKISSLRYLRRVWSISNFLCAHNVELWGLRNDDMAGFPHKKEEREISVRYQSIYMIKGFLSLKGDLTHSSPLNWHNGVIEWRLMPRNIFECQFAFVDVEIRTPTASAPMSESIERLRRDKGKIKWNAISKLDDEHLRRLFNKTVRDASSVRCHFMCARFYLLSFLMTNWI